MIRLGIIGTSWWVERAYLPGAQMAGNLSVTALCGRNTARLEELAARFEIPQTFSDVGALLASPEIEAAAVVLPNGLHYPVATLALEAGKHVICEKPLALSAQQARSLRDDAASRGLATMVPFTWCFTPAALRLKQLIDEGYIGRLYSVTGRYLSSWLLDTAVPAGWRTRRESSGTGAIGDLGSHLVALTLFLTGTHVTEVTASCRLFTPARVAPDADAMERVDVEDSCVFLAHFACGAHGSFHVDRASAGAENLVELTLHGSAGAVRFALEIEGTDWPLGQAYGTHSTAWDAKMAPIPIPAGLRRGFDAFRPQPKVEFVFAEALRAFAKSVGSAGADDVCGFALGTEVQAVLDALDRSGRERSWTEVEDAR